MVGYTDARKFGPCAGMRHYGELAEPKWCIACRRGTGDVLLCARHVPQILGVALAMSLTLELYTQSGQNGDREHAERARPVFRVIDSQQVSNLPASASALGWSGRPNNKARARKRFRPRRLDKRLRCDIPGQGAKVIA